MDNPPKTTANINERLYYIDWIRVLAFAILILVHAGIPFVPFGLPMIQNNETSEVLSLVIYFLHDFRLEVLFLVSGVGTYFAMRKLSSAGFIAERCKRLILPTVFACFTLMPLMIYFEKMHVGDFSGGFFEFFPEFFTNGAYPRGNFSWGQMWFVVYLFCFVLIAQPLFRYFQSEKGINFLTVIQNKLCNGNNIYLMIIPFFLLEISLRPHFPGARDLIHDWASFSQWLLYFIVGYIFVSAPRLFTLVETLRHRCLLVALVFSALVMFLRTLPDLGYIESQINRDSLFMSFILVAKTWCWVLTILGFAKRYLQRNSTILQYCNEAVYPIFILHFTVSVALSYWIVQCSADIGVWTKFGIVSLWTFVIIMATYHFVIRPFSLMRLLFGLKVLSK